MEKIDELRMIQQIHELLVTRTIVNISPIFGRYSFFGRASDTLVGAPEEKQLEIFDKVECSHLGHIFSIDLSKIKPALVELLKKTNCARAIDSVRNNELPSIEFEDKGVISSYLLGNEMEYAGVYRPIEEGFAAEIKLVKKFCRPAYRWAPAHFGRNLGDARDDVHTWFAYLVAHELRHWIQDISPGMGIRSWGGRLVCQMVFGGLALTLASFLAFSPMLFLSSAHTWVVVLGIIYLFREIILLRGRMVHSRALVGTAFGKWMDRLFNRVIFWITPYEIDARAFGRLAAQDPRWLDVVRVERLSENERNSHNKQP